MYSATGLLTKSGDMTMCTVHGRLVAGGERGTCDETCRLGVTGGINACGE